MKHHAKSQVHTCGFADVERKGNMKKISNAKLLFALLGSLTIASAAGSIGG